MDETPGLAQAGQGQNISRFVQIFDHKTISKPITVNQANVRILKSNEYGKHLFARNEKYHSRLLQQVTLCHHIFKLTCY